MTPEQIETYVDAAAAVLQLPLAAAHRPGVLHYFALAATMADALGSESLTINDDPAETFLPVSSEVASSNNRGTGNPAMPPATPAAIPR